MQNRQVHAWRSWARIVPICRVIGDVVYTTNYVVYTLQNLLTCSAQEVDRIVRHDLSHEAAGYVGGLYGGRRKPRPDS